MDKAQIKAKLERHGAKREIENHKMMTITKKMIRINFSPS